ncbi:MULTISPECIES: outer membrane protein [Hyphomonas]|jgi:opacity protein-like surface antigen|uniref:OmpA family protein n=1 Tax=Hyphomonas jannaschiana VP2 TaxID=1280952 RepID=A0A059FB11_9PROT|nr:porin family protein [Hyphomonas jannaschiana]KCZ87741.1 OmpA family protein [Hyphomonas jannaschiana VP2]
MLKYILAATVATGIAGAAAAQENGLYLEGGYQYLEIEPDGADSGVDTNAIGARLGYQFNPVFSIEGELASGIDDGEFDYNVDEDSFNLDDNNDGDFNDLIAASGDIGLNYLVGLYGKAEVPLTDRLDVYGRAGYAYVDLDASIQTPGGTTLTTIEDAEEGPAFGAGLSYDLTENVYLKGDYTYYSFEDTDTNGVMLGVGYKF